MSLPNSNSKLEKVRKLNKYYGEKSGFFYRKWQRARKSESRQSHFKNYRFYGDLALRSVNLYNKLNNTLKFGEVNEWSQMDPKWYIEFITKRKSERKKHFDSKYRIQLHFRSESLNADYGTFICDHCNWTFHHSPSTVYKGSVKTYSNCCGNCVNSLLERNKQQEIYC
jgi:hypothetical protein